MRASVSIRLILPLTLILTLAGQSASADGCFGGAGLASGSVRVLGVIQEGISIPADIRPLECPNILNVNSRGKIPMALVGVPEYFEADKVDPETVRLVGAAPIDGSGWLEDRTSPWEGEDPLNPYVGKEDFRDCVVWDDEAPPLDEVEDFNVKFQTQDVVESLEGDLGRELEDGEVLVLLITGQLVDGTDFWGEDVIVVKNKKRKK